jgi:outer membrane protein assembly factor BamB
MVMRVQIKGASYEPHSPDEHIRGISLLLPVQERGGFVFLIAYTKKENSDAELLLQTLMDQARRLAETFGSESNPQHRFEQFLGALNETLAQHVKEARWHIPIEHVHALVGIASSTEMYLSGTGELIALFLHKKPSRRYQVFNLFRGLQTEQSLPTWEKVFAVVLDGDLHPGDVFCITDKDIQQAIPTDELNHILSSLPPVGAVEKIRQYFSHKDGMLLTVLKIIDDALPRSPDSSKTAVPQSNVSVEALISTEETTDRLLNDQRPGLSIFFKKIHAFVRSKTDQRSRLLLDLQSQGGAKDVLKRVGWLTWKLLGILGRHARRLTKRSWHLLTHKQERARVKKHLHIQQRRISTGTHGVLERIRGLPRSTKYLVIGIAVAAIVLMIGISVISKSQARTQEETSYQESLATIEDLMERAGGAVIYKDEAQARNLYMNASTLIDELPTNTNEQQEVSQKLSRDLQAALNDIRHLVTIPNPPLLADLETLTDGVFGNSITQTPDALLVAGSDGRLYTFNRNEKRFDVLATPEESSPSPIASSQEDGRVYVLSTEGQVYGVSFENKTLSLVGIQDPLWIDLEAYADRLYLLRPGEGSQGQIVRFNRSGGSFVDQSEWITSRTISMNTAVSLAIDGDVYVLMRNGSVSRFTNGTEDGWSTAVVDPIIDGATKIWTNSDSNYLYVLEPNTQRLIVFQKDTGAFVVQYRSEAFQDLTDFIVDEEGYTIYLLAGSKLYSIAPSHLK